MIREAAHKREHGRRVDDKTFYVIRVKALDSTWPVGHASEQHSTGMTKWPNQLGHIPSSTLAQMTQCVLASNCLLLGMLVLKYVQEFDCQVF